MMPMAGCTERTCSGGGSYLCHYTDDQGNTCWTHWCEEHVRLLSGDAYCRRHASTTAALRRLPTRTGDSAPFPPVPNRGASLLRWMMLDVDDAVSQLFISEGITKGEKPSTIGSTELIGNTSKWSWHWSANSGNGAPPRVVTISVEEEADDHVTVTVDGRLRIRGKPPWVAHHQLHESIDPTTDALERQHYRELIISEIAAALY